MVVEMLLTDTTEMMDDTTRYYIHTVRTNIYMGLYRVSPTRGFHHPPPKYL